MSAHENNDQDTDVNALIEKSNSVEQLEYLYSIYETQYNNTTQNINSHAKVMNELINSSLVLGKGDDIRNSSLVLNLGNSIYANARIENHGNILVNIGLNYIAEKSAGEAKEFIDKKIKSYEKEIEFLNKGRSEIRNVLFKITYKLSEMNARHEHHAGHASHSK
ncbi:prefoldin subunit alpha [Candidatus Marsarchaeota archaeon]|nr:prefoldin subunit alpha [Candidatus Marsarchaeota archaeon]